MIGGGAAAVTTGCRTDCVPAGGNDCPVVGCAMIGSGSGPSRSGRSRSTGLLWGSERTSKTLPFAFVKWRSTGGPIFTGFLLADGLSGAGVDVSFFSFLIGVERTAGPGCWSTSVSFGFLCERVFAAAEPMVMNSIKPRRST